jgi:PKHD-type hydroxylase
MLLHIPAVLSPREAQQMRRRLEEEAEWGDGRGTAGPQGARVKRNQQLDPASPLARQLASRILHALAGNALFYSAALPLKTLPPLFNRYVDTGAYGLHVDSAVMSQQGTLPPLRSDVSATLFLSDPDSYHGGELVVKDTYGAHEVKLPAGDLVVYPSTSLHEVQPVTRGERLAAFFWTQSMVRDDARRTMLFELDQTLQSLRRRLGDNEETTALTGHYHNLVRAWAEL